VPHGHLDEMPPGDNLGKPVIWLRDAPPHHYTTINFTTVDVTRARPGAEVRAHVDGAYVLSHAARSGVIFGWVLASRTARPAGSADSVTVPPTGHGRRRRPDLGRLPSQDRRVR